MDQAVPALRRLEFYGAGWIDDEALSTLSRAATLEALVLESGEVQFLIPGESENRVGGLMRFTAAGVAKLARLKNLTELVLCGGPPLPVDALLALRGLPLRTLRLRASEVVATAEHPDPEAALHAAFPDCGLQVLGRVRQRPASRAR